MTKNKHWWQKTTIYQIYPRSFKDSNNDGIGDIHGIISKLDYIKELGFETIWISPFFKSPQQDWGYDVSDFYNIDPDYGNLNDVEELIEQIHRRGMRILFDLVLNHTSDQHPWFLESRSTLKNPKRDWYIWRDGRGSRPPNNWRSTVGGSGWHHDQGTNQWYYASFLPFQPDLNYRNPEVVHAMSNIAKYWLDKGIDGYRLDIFHTIFKDQQFRDNPFSFQLMPRDFMSGYFQKWMYNLNQPETIQLAIDLRELVDSYSPERMLIGEIFADDATVRKYLGQEKDGLNLVFLWNLMDLQLNAGFLRNVVRHNEAYYPEPFTPVYVFGNHDRQRFLSRIGGDKRMASLLALFQFTTRGVPVTYYGEEIGMSEVRLPNSTARDPTGRRFNWIPQLLLDWLNLYTNRDGCRTPIHWDDHEHAGFCDPGTTPWLPINKNYKRVNVKVEQHDGGSILNVYRDLLCIRKENPALQEGSLELLDGPGIADQLLAYTRSLDQEMVLVLINLSETECTFSNPTQCKQELFQIGKYKRAEERNIVLHPLSGVVLTT
jgi:alpha-glucosidase